MPYQTIDVRRTAGALGAEILGPDLSKPLDNQTFSEIHQAFLDHQVIFFRDQDLTPEQYLAFGSRFGAPTRYPFSTGMPGYPDLFEIRKEPEEKRNFGGGWHSDGTYLETPPLGTMLYAKETPTHGGDTQWSSMYAAYDALSDGMKNLLDGLIGINSAELKKSGGRANRGKVYQNMALSNLDEADKIVAEHPLVRTHPGTGRKGLYLNQAHTVCIKGLTEEESKPILDWLCRHLTRPEFTCRFHWRVGSIALWDNRCTQHFAINDYPGQRRVMHRITMGAEKPV